MKSRFWIFSVAAALFLGVACQSAHTETSGSPQVIGVPDDLAAPVAPASGDSTPAQPAPAAPMKHSYNSVNAGGPFIALTFDDGPKPGQTDRLLDILKEKGVKATFFVIGKNVAEYPEIVRRMVDEGHEVANHTWSHPSLTKLGAAAVEREIKQTDAAIVAAGAPQPTIMRPPYGATNARLNQRLSEEFGQKVILWSVDPLDWKIRKAAHVRDHILANTKPGGIVLAHDIHASTVDAMPGTIDGLKEKGFQFVTVTELLRMDRPATPAAPTAPTAAAN
ncbi:MAG: polysaccharide deacetylase family protein [Terrimicrobiaceae bacterium]|nr:polysaccharide deacetylase family protein [Terrimicrobiaceae bacterium]